MYLLQVSMDFCESANTKKRNNSPLSSKDALIQEGGPWTMCLFTEVKMEDLGMISIDPITSLPPAAK